MREGPGKGPYSWINYSQVFIFRMKTSYQRIVTSKWIKKKVIDQVRCVGSSIINNGIESNNETHIGIYSANRNEVN